MYIKPHKRTAQLREIAALRPAGPPLPFSPAIPPVSPQIPSSAGLRSAAGTRLASGLARSHPHHWIRGEASEYLREIGGLMFINDLAKSSAHCIVKEAALFTLGIIIESNVYCQQTLCTSALFEDLILFLIKKDSGVNLKRMSVYVILALVSNNKNGQSCVRDTGCISLLLQLFRTTLSTSEKNVSDENSDACYQLWCSVCSALCACVNNPQNEDNQKICCSVFPHAKEWLETCTEPGIVRPICSFLGLTVANNSYVQKYFASIGGLDTLAKVLLELMHDSCLSHSSMKLAVIVTKTLDACIANNCQHSFCSEKTERVKSTSAISSSHKIPDLRCLGCTAGGLSLNSKTFTKMLQRCLHRCEHHRVILEAEERYRGELRRVAAGNSNRSAAHQKMLPASVEKDRLHKEISTFRSKKDRFQSILLTPNRKDKSNTSKRDEYSRNTTRWTSNYNLTPAYENSLQKSQDANQKRQRVKEMCSQKCQHLKENCTHSLDKDEGNKMYSLAMNTRPLNKRRVRKDFTTEEINCLLKGVQKMGNHWNLILWSYPFQKGRTSVDLSKKYYRLQVQMKKAHKGHQ
ncbi:telomere repeats-binding bouquet formation protein 1 [Zonotrichia leucophrys gambelii]|uniref:telomere repeats-binding bouquet formation protein 1 n=1 Tax=Zonotrichia leucophrys gambelii TaxID=257770 RepID=UPI00313FE994